MGSIIVKPGRPIISTPITMTDKVLEIIALSGVLFNLIIVAYGIARLPDIVPTHVGSSGSIDGYGNKWLLAVILVLINIALYAFITFANRYPHIFNYPVIVTAENAPGLYKLAQRAMRLIKLVISWLFATMSWWFIIVLPYHQDWSAYGLLIDLPFLILTGAIVLYYAIKIIQEDNRHGTV